MNINFAELGLPMTKARRAERLYQAARVIWNTPKHHFDYATWGEKGATNECGTQFCIAGACSLDPWFRKRGFVADWESALYDKLELRPRMSWHSYICKFFGMEHVELFFPAGDNGLGDYTDEEVMELTPKQVANSLVKYIERFYNIKLPTMAQYHKAA